MQGAILLKLTTSSVTATRALRPPLFRTTSPVPLTALSADCISRQGIVLDVAVDLRRNSPTYGQWYAVELSGENHLQFFIPRGFAHGFSVLSDTATFTYKCDNLYHPEAEGGILLSDPELNIDWRLPADLRILSDKDRRHPLLKDIQTPFES